MRARRKHVFLNLRHKSFQTERRLMRMVEQNGGKFESFWNIMKDSRFVQIENFFGRCSLGDVKNRMRN